MTKQRLEAENLIYQVMDKLDPSEKNKEFWMEEFSKMTDEQFKSYISKPLCFYFQTGAFKEPSFDNIRYALEKILKVPLLESIYMPFKYKDTNGNPVKSKPCLVLYINYKKMKQFITKKNSIKLDNSMRDMKTGQLTGASKQARTSDHEFESLAISGLTATEKELSRPRGEAITDKEIMNNQIKTLGQVSLEDLPNDITDSLGKQNLSAMFIGAQLMTSLVIDEEDYMTPYTKQSKNLKINRVD